MGLFWVESGKERKRVGQRERFKGKEREGGERGERKLYLNNEIESYSNHVNIHLHGYCSILAYAQYYKPTDVGSFLAKICKILHFFYFPRTDAIALSLYMYIFRQAYTLKI